MISQNAKPVYKHSCNDYDNLDFNEMIKEMGPLLEEEKDETRLPPLNDEKNDNFLEYEME